MNIRYSTYLQENKEAILEIFFSNCPKYFDVADEKSLIEFLENYADENFNVVWLDSKIVGCGGHYVDNDKNVCGIAWVMFERYSMGSIKFIQVANMLFERLLESIKNEKKKYDIIINTTQLMEKILIKYGFFTTEIIKEGFGKNLDHYKMKRSF